MSYTVPEMEWPTVTKNKTSLLLSERHGTTNGRWYLGLEDEDAEQAIRKTLASYKVPIYHITIDEFRDMGHMPGYKGRVPYVDSRYVYVWTFSAPKTPAVHVYYQGGDRSEDKVCHYEKTVDVALLTDRAFECEDIIARMRAL